MASVERARTKQGGWTVRYRDDRRRSRAKTFQRKADADRFASTVEADMLRGEWIDPRLGRLTFDEWWEHWWPSTASLRASTRARDEAYWRSRIAPALGAVPLDRLDRTTLRAWLADLTAAGLAPSTVHKAAQIVSKALRAAVEDGRIARNPAERLDLPRLERGEPRFLTPGQVDQLADAIHPRYRALIVLGAYGGLRLGEMLALRRARVDLLRARVEVLATLVEVSGRLTENAPKTRAGRRTVPLPRSLSPPSTSTCGLGPAGPTSSSSWPPRAAPCAPASGGEGRGPRPCAPPSSSRSIPTTSGTPRSPSGSPPARAQPRSPRAPATRPSSPCSTATGTCSRAPRSA